MTKEIVNTLTAFKAAQQEGRQTVLATIVHVESKQISNNFALIASRKEKAL